MLIARDDGKWENVRVKNELARSLSVGHRDAIDLASRTAEIAKRLGKPCHVMWFVGCMDQDGNSFNIPWYWTEAHDSEKNTDRFNYHVVTITNRLDLGALKRRTGARRKLALKLMPSDQKLIRDMEFIQEVGATSLGLGVPVILAGSPLAHAYFTLRRQGCTVISASEKERSRVRRSAFFGKMVRDKIPSRIDQRKEASVTSEVDDGLKKKFLTGKLLEEALEVRNASNPDEKRMELADLYEVLRALAQAEGISMEEIVAAADKKRAKAGGFDKGLVLFQTGILGQNRESIKDDDKLLAHVLLRKSSIDRYEVPFTFFGFRDLDQPLSLVFEDFGIRINVTLKTDRIELHVLREAEQLELPLGDQ
jgi:predicted house-cleaning noncanonical NTP pyrophosphatase (MazG superfamily)